MFYYTTDIATIEFHKRGLPHAHILLFLDISSTKLTPEVIDKIISAEIPSKELDPYLFDIVTNCMVHGPCGHLNPNATCMIDKKCSKYFPKKFVNVTTVDGDGYPTYRRRDDGRTTTLKGIELDNRYVVPYNPILLR